MLFSQHLSSDEKKKDVNLKGKTQGPCISAIEPYIPTKEPYISAKEPYISTKEPYF